MTNPPSDMTPRPITDHWHIKKEVQIGHILTTLSVAFSVIWYAGKLEQRIALVEKSVITQEKRDDAQDNATNAAVSQIRAQFDRIDAKLDRIIEARSRP